MTKYAQWARIGMIVADDSKRSRFIYEILAHAGLFYEEIACQRLEMEIRSFAIILVVGDKRFDASEAATLAQHVQNGATLITVGACANLESVLGVQPEYFATETEYLPVSLGEGRLLLQNEHPLFTSADEGLPFFGGAAVKAAGATPLALVYDKHHRPTERVAVSERELGHGLAIGLYFDLCGSVMRMQQGLYVDQDALPAPDGSANLSDGVLRAEDGMTLDWEFDRQKLPGSDTPLFAKPAADQLKAILLRAIMRGAAKNGFVLPMLWYYPRHLNALGHFSHICQSCETNQALILMNALRMVGIRSTWNAVYPGYPLDLYRVLKKQDHEIGLCYDAVNGGDWHEERLKIQYTHLQRAAGYLPVANHNLGSRWEGRTAFYKWCDQIGIHLDGSRGGTQPGASGFLFGTCHPSLPMSDEGHFYRCYSLPFLARNPSVNVPIEACLHLIETVALNHGVAHFCLELSCVHDNQLNEGLRRIAAAVRAKNMEWWKAEEILNWERARRKLKAILRDGAAGIFLAVTAEEALEDATLLFLAPNELSATVRGKPVNLQRITRYGFEFHALTLSYPARAPVDIYLQ